MSRITFSAREAQVQWIVATSVLPGDDVLDMKREKVEIVLVNAAILTAVSSTPSNEQAHSGIDHHASEWFASSCRAFDLSKATNVPNDT